MILVAAPIGKTHFAIDVVISKVVSWCFFYLFSGSFPLRKRQLGLEGNITASFGHSSFKFQHETF